MARWTASAKWAAGPALDGWRGTLLGLGLNEGLGLNTVRLEYCCGFTRIRGSPSPSLVTRQAKTREINALVLKANSIGLGRTRATLGF